MGITLLAAALVYAGWMMSRSLGGQYRRGYLGHNGARYSIMARNVLRCDLKTANFAPLLNMEDEEEPDPYLHHPPLLHWVLALVFHVFGETEDHARMVPYAFTLLNLVLLFLLGRRVLKSSFSAGLCALLAASLPMTSYYGIHIDVQGSPLVFFILACILCYLKWINGEGRTWLLLSLACLVLGTLFDWPAFYLCFLIPLHYWRIHKKENLSLINAAKKTAPFMAVGGLLFLILFLWLSVAVESKGTSLWGSVIVRTVKPDSHLEFGDPWRFFLNSVTTSCRNIHTLYPWAFLLLIALGWILRRNDPNEEDPHYTSCSLRLLFLVGTCHLVFFPFGLLFHDYWVFLFVPWAALAGSLALSRLASRVKGRQGYAVLTLALCAVVIVGHLYSRDRSKAGDPFPAYIGKVIHQVAKPGEAVLTNGYFNSYVPGSEDRYMLSSPAYSYYADRVIRGVIWSRKIFEMVIQQRDDFAYFVFIPVIQYNEEQKKEEAKLLQFLNDRYEVVETNVKHILFFRLK